MRSTGQLRREVELKRPPRYLPRPPPPEPRPSQLQHQSAHNLGCGLAALTLGLIVGTLLLVAACNALVRSLPHDDNQPVAVSSIYDNKCPDGSEPLSATQTNTSGIYRLICPSPHDRSATFPYDVYRP
jgi:hypothetical protein